MAQITIRVEHALGREEALKRLRDAAEAHRAQIAPHVRTMEWTQSGVRVVGDSFQGEITVGERDATATVELGWKLAFFPLKVQREGELWLRRLLGTGTQGAP